MSRGALWLACLLAACLAPARAAAFAEPETFSLTPHDLDADVPQGGGGGRFFTGSLRDGFTCAVCHRMPADGVTDQGFEVLGWPEDGYVPGTPIDIVINFPNDITAAASLEVTRLDGSGVGTLEVAPNPTPQDQCPGMDPDPPTDAVSIIEAPQSRQVAVSEACPRGLGVRGRTRARWTPPGEDVGQVWLHVAGVASDGLNDTTGDVVFTFSRLIAAEGTTANPPMGGTSCAVSPLSRGPGGWAIVGLAAAWIRRRRRA